MNDRDLPRDRRRARLAGLLLPALLCLAAPLVAESVDDDGTGLSESDQKLLLSGLKANAKDSNALIRAAAARDVPTLQTVDTIKIAHQLLGDSEAMVRNAAMTAISTITDEESLRWLAQDGRRKGTTAQRALCIMALGLVKDVDIVREPLLLDLDASDPALKAAAITALADQAIKEAMPRIAEFATHSDTAVREAVAVAIGYIGSGADMDAMRILIKDEEWEVRSAMINAASRLEIKPVVSLLISRLPEEEGRLRQDLRDALVKLTGEDFGMDPDLWTSWWEANKADYGVTEKIEMKVTRDDYGETTEYYGIKIYSTKVLFVIDTSESMGGPANSLADNKVSRRAQEGDRQRSYKGATKMEIAKEELSYVVEDLGDNVYFNIITYNTDVEPWKPGPVKATPANKKSAIKFIEKLSPKPNGATNIHGAMMEALGVTGKSTAAAAKQRKFVDTIFLLADGEPTYGLITDPVDILREIRYANPDARVIINAVRLGVLGNSKFMVDLAAQNGGVFVEIN